MSALLGQVVPIAFAAAISPVIFLLELNTLIGANGGSAML